MCEILWNIHSINIGKPILQAHFIFEKFYFACTKTIYYCHKWNEVQGLFHVTSQPAFTCSKLTIETIEQRCEICSKLTINWTYFINFEDVIAGWVVIVIYRFWAHNLDAQRKSVTKQTTDLKNDMYFTFLPFENWVRYG